MMLRNVPHILLKCMINEAEKDTVHKFALVKKHGAINVEVFKIYINFEKANGRIVAWLMCKLALTVRCTII